MLPSLHRLSLATTGADDDESELVEAVGGLQLMNLPNDVLEYLRKLLIEGLADPKELSNLACQDVLSWCDSHRDACNDPAAFLNAMALFGLRTRQVVALQNATGAVVVHTTDAALTPPFDDWTMKYTFRVLCDLWSRTEWWFAPELPTHPQNRVLDVKFRLRSAIPALGYNTNPLLVNLVTTVAEESSVIIGGSMTFAGLWATLVDTMDFQLRHRLRQPSCPLRDLYWARSCYTRYDDSSEKLVFGWWVDNRLMAKCEELGLPFDDELYSDTQQRNRWLIQDRALYTAVFSIDDAYWNENAWATHAGWAIVRRRLNEGANPFWDPRGVVGDDHGLPGAGDNRDSVFQRALKNATRDAVLEGEGFFSLLDAILDVAGGHVVQGWGLTIWNYSMQDEKALMAFTLDMWRRPGVPSAGVRLRTLKMLNHLLSDGAEMLYELARGEFGNRVNPYRNVNLCHINDQGETDCTHAESAGPIQWLVRKLYATLVNVGGRWSTPFPPFRDVVGVHPTPPELVAIWQTLHDEMRPQYEAVVAKVRAVEEQAYQTWLTDYAARWGNP